jgi:pyroglutamyl-peptidase
MHTLERRRALQGVRGGFIHLPFLPGQGTPHMALGDMQRGLRIAIACALATRQDVKIGAGTEH